MRSPATGRGHSSSAATSAAGYLAGAFAYVAVPLALAFVATRPSRAALADTLIPPRDRRLVAAAFWGTLLIPPVLSRC